MLDWTSLLPLSAQIKDPCNTWKYRYWVPTTSISFLKTIVIGFGYRKISSKVPSLTIICGGFLAFSCKPSGWHSLAFGRPLFQTAQVSWWKTQPFEGKQQFLASKPWLKKVIRTIHGANTIANNRNKIPGDVNRVLLRPQAECEGHGWAPTTAGPPFSMAHMKAHSCHLQGQNMIWSSKHQQLAVLYMGSIYQLGGDYHAVLSEFNFLLINHSHNPSQFHW